MLSIISAVLAVAVVLASPLLPAVGGPEWPSAVQQQNQNEPERIDVNTATAEELQSVPGIGETLAKRIVEFREEHGPFEKVDDLLNVRGIGVASLDKLRPFLSIKHLG
jgi:competence protein ComEA